MKKLNAFGISALMLVLSSTVIAQENCNVSATLDIVAPACEEGATGTVTINATGGVEPYNYWINGNPTTATTSGLVAGYYDYWVEDALHCWYKADFTVECEPEENCEHRTQTQGGWGAKPSGNNPAAYLQAHFASCFPNGISIGCASNNTLLLTSSTAVKNFLPQGGTPAPLPSDAVNPSENYGNVLAGQLVAATINVTVDACDPDFSAASGWSGDLTYVGGTFAGWTVAQVIDAANQFIGGCGGSYTASQFNAALTMFNENYVGGTIDNGNFSCKKVEKE